MPIKLNISDSDKDLPPLLYRYNNDLSLFIGLKVFDNPIRILALLWPAVQ